MLKYLDIIQKRIQKEQSSELVYKSPPLLKLKLVYSCVIEVSDSESYLGLHDKALVSKIQVVHRIKVT